MVSRHVHLSVTFLTGPLAHPAIVRVEWINWSTFSVSKVQIVMLWSQKQRLQTIPGSPGACWSGLYAYFAWDVCACGSVSRADLVKWALLDHRPDLLQPQLPHPRQGRHFPLQSKARLTKNIHRVSMKLKMPSCSFFLLCMAKWFIKFNDWRFFISLLFSYYCDYYFHTQHFCYSHDEQFSGLQSYLRLHEIWLHQADHFCWKRPLQMLHIQYSNLWLPKKKESAFSSSVNVWHQIMQMCPPFWLVSNLIKNLYYIRRNPLSPQQPAASRSSEAHSWMAATSLDRWPDLSEGSLQSRWTWKAATVNSHSAQQ